jgi:hypothetical protein
LKKLRKLALERTFVPRSTFKGEIQIESLKVHFPCASLKLVKNSGLLDILKDNTYLGKAIVSIDKRNVLFGELATLGYLEKDGWCGVWVDSFHSSKNNDKLWVEMPPKGSAPGFPPRVQERFNAIKQKNGGKLSGFFDVFAWKGDGDDYVFIEYKGKDDSPNENESQ